METRYDTTPDEETREAAPSTWQRFVKQLLAIFGAIAVFLGLFIMFAGDNQSLGIFDATWQVGDIADEWAYGLLIGGGLVLVGVFAWILQGMSRRRS